MATYFEAVLPSGMCIRLRDLKTRDKLAIEGELSEPTPEKRGVKAQLESLSRCLLAHTEPQSWIRKEIGAKISAENLQKIAQALKDANVDTPTQSAVIDVLLPKTVADTDAMLAAVPAKGWVQDNPVSLRTEGTSVQDILHRPADFDAAWGALNRASGFGDDASRPFVPAGTLRKVSAE